ncbi:MAG: DUF2868 domain-containing protein [Limnobacter sp.]|nr:DUF2868 domain-containing protein [Limnobacter sp.]
MTEDDARNALLVRAWETAPPGHVDWTDDDRAWASRAAAEVEGEHAPADVFVARRARLAIERIAGRERKLHRALRAVTWRPWIGPVLAAVAFVLGVATDAIGTGQRINVLAPPLLAVMLWNLVVYLVMVARALAGLVDRGGDTTTAARIGARAGPAARLLARAAHMASLPRRGSGKLAGGGVDGTASVLTRFNLDWAQASARLNATRIARMLHLGAIAFAAGALAGMYVRGLALEYRAGWESTFLDAGAIRATLDVVLGPASWLTGIALPDEARLEAMRFPQTDGEPAAPWIHLYAVSVALVVLLPRALLALRDWLVERRLAADFPLSLDDAYFAALTRSHRGEAAQVAVVPYSHQPSPQAVLALRESLSAVLGPMLRLSVAPTVVYGDEDSAGSELPSERPLALAIALFSATATPEPDSQRAFVDALAASLPAEVPLLLLVDESTFVSRFGDDPTARRRLDERRKAWNRLLAHERSGPLFVDLERSDAQTAVRKLRSALDRLSQPGTQPAALRTG